MAEGEKTLSDLEAFDRMNIAKMISQKETWSYLGLSFKEKYGFEISKAMLKAKSSRFSGDEELGKQLLESLAERLVTMKDFIQALALIGLHTAAAKVRKEYSPDPTSNVPIMDNDSIKLEEANRDLKKGDQVLLLKGMNRGQIGKLVDVTPSVIAVELQDGRKTFPDKTSFVKMHNCKDFVPVI